MNIAKKSRDFFVLVVCLCCLVLTMHASANNDFEDIIIPDNGFIFEAIVTEEINNDEVVPENIFTEIVSDAEIVSNTEEIQNNEVASDTIFTEVVPNNEIVSDTIFTEVVPNNVAVSKTIFAEVTTNDKVVPETIFTEIVSDAEIVSDTQEIQNNEVASDTIFTEVTPNNEVVSKTIFTEVTPNDEVISKTIFAEVIPIKQVTIDNDEILATVKDKIIKKKKSKVQRFSKFQGKTYQTCFKAASKKHDIPVHWLYAISFTESSFNPRSSNSNSNGTRDYGLMQINTFWKKEAGRLGYSWKQIKTDPCTNIMFGGHILKSNLKRTKNMAKAIGAYNVGFSKTAKAKRLRKKYYNKVRRNRYIAKRHLHRLKKKIRKG